jgi:hypothetical protein
MFPQAVMNLLGLLLWICQNYSGDIYWGYIQQFIDNCF